MTSVFPASVDFTDAGELALPSAGGVSDRSALRKPTHGGVPGNPEDRATVLPPPVEAIRACRLRRQQFIVLCRPRLIMAVDGAAIGCGTATWSCMQVLARNGSDVANVVSRQRTTAAALVVRRSARTGTSEISSGSGRQP
ncbi:MAG TPA: hypothetical protein VMM76_27060 [Pirellulaceae bacterium]|nr:hypothetical protein [Pirellulaceae bacterium]